MVEQPVVAKKTLGRDILAGVLTGQVAGLIMAVVVMAVFALFLEKSLLYPVQVIGSVYFGEAALQGVNIQAIIAGLLIHQLGPSLVWGIVFGLLARQFQVQSTSKALIFGLLLGAVTMIDVYVFVPLVMNWTVGVDIWNREVPMAWDWAAHLVFGASFVFYPAIRRRLSS